MKRIRIPRLFNRKKLSAATARRASAASAGMDFEGIPEPNMKLSRALLIVLLLHVVAVSGIIAFNAIKTRERAFVPPTSTETENKHAETTQTATHANTDKPPVVAAQKESDRQHESKRSHSPARDEQAKKTPSSSGKTYVVKKGDNPVGIAKKLKVSYNDLMTLNHIDDPRKLQIGQKLLIPDAAKPKTTSAKAADKKKKQNEVSEKSDAKTHRTPKAPRAKSTDTSASFGASFCSLHACSRRLHALTPHAS
jgi:nucleoid-associated protein YgaU